MVLIRSHRCYSWHGLFKVSSRKLQGRFTIAEGEESEQVHGYGIEQNMSTTSFAICLFLFRLVVPIAMILNKLRRR